MRRTLLYNEMRIYLFEIVKPICGNPEGFPSAISMDGETLYLEKTNILSLFNMHICCFHEDTYIILKKGLFLDQNK